MIDPSKKVALLGFAESYKQAPHDDPSVEIWGINDLYRYLKRWDRWFEMHPRSVINDDKDPRTGRPHLTWLSEQAPGKPIYMQQHFEDIPASVPYPLDEMIARFFPGQPKGYFTSTISYMLAKAIAEGYGWIGLYGIDLAADSEYAYQRPAAEYLIGVARGLGITVVIADGSALLKSDRLYGYDDLALSAAQQEEAYLQKLLGEVTDKRGKCLDMLHHLDGSIAILHFQLKRLDYLRRGIQAPELAA